MVDHDQIFDTPLIIEPDMKEDDIANEWDKMVERSQKTKQMIEGAISVEDFLDFLESQGYEPDEVIDEFDRNIDFVINKGVWVE